METSHILGQRDDKLIELWLPFAIMADSSVTLSLFAEEKELGETEGLLLLLHLTRRNYTNNNT